ncbi:MULTISPECIES: hypothetical protein [unclassified Streptomyces]|uniref:hypothetical protein n=1 Tax=unclassified Streptomyces TaxID=2593676 RepID=UPI002E28ECD1|nr:hypothetical protein [Streptomyces sp. NBC_00208]WSF81989.1 hypothetical protein OIE70_01570 [Streptomyces sp. NBC_01744]
MRAVEAFFDVILGRIADPSVPVGCLIAESAAQSLTLKEEYGTQVRGLLDTQRQRVHAALADSSADSQTLDELATFVVAVNRRWPC